MTAPALIMSLLILAGVGFICLIVAIVLAVKRRWKAMAIALGCTLVCCIAAVTFGAILAALPSGDTRARQL